MFGVCSATRGLETTDEEVEWHQKELPRTNSVSSSHCCRRGDARGVAGAKNAATHLVGLP